MKHRSAAKAQRIANIYPMIAVDEREDGQQKQQLEKAILLPMVKIDLKNWNFGNKFAGRNEFGWKKRKRKTAKYTEGKSSEKGTQAGEAWRIDWFAKTTRIG